MSVPRAPALGGAGPGETAIVLDGERGRSLLFLGILLLAWVTVNPFASLSDSRWLDPNGVSDVLNQVVYVALGGCAAAFFVRRPQFLRVLARPIYGLTMAWLLVTVVASQDPAGSARRLVFMMFVVVLGAAAPLLPSSRRHFSDLLAAVTVTVLLLSYAGVVLVPDLAIHQVTDLVEPRLAGNWRGIFIHKNIAGEMMGVFVFVGIYLAQVRSVALGLAIAAGAAVFLFFTEAKTAMAFLPLVMALVWTGRGGFAFALRMAVFLLIIVALNALCIGSLSFPAVKAVVERLFSDPTFTGRTEIWQLALDWFAKRPLVGFGYGSFWKTDLVIYSGSLIMDEGAALADHAHNAVLNLAVTTGVPGVALALAWAVLLPCRDIVRCLRGNVDKPLADLFLRIWTFALANCCFESILFARGDPLWSTMLIAMFGLRFLSVCRVAGVEQRASEAVHLSDVRSR